MNSRLRGSFHPGCCLFTLIQMLHVKKEQTYHFFGTEKCIDQRGLIKDGRILVN